MSVRPVRVTSLAESDFTNALDWYRAASPRAAQRFLESFEKAYSLMESMPLAWQRVHGEPEIRRIGLNGFPYLLIYELTELEIVVLAVHHASRSERNWTDRVNEEPATYGKEAAIMESTAPQLREALYQAGLCLPEEERIALGQRLLHSVRPEETPAEVLQESRRRFAEFDKGESEAVPMQDAIREMREQLG